MSPFITRLVSFNNVAAWRRGLVRLLSLKSHSSYRTHLTRAHTHTRPHTQVSQLELRIICLWYTEMHPSPQSSVLLSRERLHTPTMSRSPPQLQHIGPPPEAVLATRTLGDDRDVPLVEEPFPQLVRLVELPLQPQLVPLLQQ